jgi:signal transduction histidine kinase
VPIIFATLAFGAQGGLATMTVGFSLLLPRALMDSGHTDHALPEIAGVMVVGSLLIVVITQQRKDVETQTNLRESMRYFVRQVITSQEDERKRIAMELHDETAQDLLLACQRLDRLITREAQRLPEDVSSQLEILRSATVDTLTGLRRLTQHLRPRVFDDHGLVAAIEWLADSLQQEYGIAVRVDAGGSLPRQDADTQLILFRIAQEALHNAGRHSGATNVVVTLTYRNGRTTMAVSDNGRGFRPSEFAALAQRGKLGLLGMHERARLLGGGLEISSLPGRGTTITVRLLSDDLRRPAGPR